VRAPRRFAWAPGQHVFVRFLGLGLHALSSHPFTVSSLHAAGAGGENTTEGEGENTVELVLRVHGGITRALAAKAAGRPAWATRVVLDGPYGGLHAPLRAFERVYLLAGGSGASILHYILI
jgi:NAD(P)H-flavin reductase